jgi:hypothetical protein
MIGSGRLFRSWVVASALWLSVFAYFLVSDWQKIGPSSAACADFEKHRVYARKYGGYSPHTIECAIAANEQNAQLLANTLKLAAFPPALLFVVGWAALWIGRVFRKRLPVAIASDPLRHFEGIDLDQSKKTRKRFHSLDAAFLPREASIDVWFLVIPQEPLPRRAPPVPCPPTGTGPKKSLRFAAGGLIFLILATRVGEVGLRAALAYSQW